MSRKSRGQQVGVALFPFLAVLICTMGALIVLLVLLVQQARVDASAIAGAKVGAAEAANADLRQRLEDAQWRRELLEKSRAEKSEELGRSRSRLAHLEEHIQRLEDQARTLLERAKSIDEGKKLRNEDLASARKEAERLKKEIEQKKKELDETKKKKSSDGQEWYALIPYEGQNGTRRRPIYVECTEFGVIIQPEGLVLRAADFMGPLGPGNPLDVALRAAREHMERTLGPKAGQPYPLLVVRPSGVVAFGTAKAAIKSWDDEWGYELISDDKHLDFGSPDAALDAALSKAVNVARQRQAAVIAMMPRHFAGEEPPKSFAHEPSPEAASRAGGGYGMGNGDGAAGGGGVGLAGGTGPGGGFGGSSGTGTGTGFGPRGAGIGGNGPGGTGMGGNGTSGTGIGGAAGSGTVSYRGNGLGGVNGASGGYGGTGLGGNGAGGSGTPGAGGTGVAGTGRNGMVGGSNGVGGSGAGGNGTGGFGSANGANGASGGGLPSATAMAMAQGGGASGQGYGSSGGAGGEPAFPGSPLNGNGGGSGGGFGSGQSGSPGGETAGGSAAGGSAGGGGTQGGGSSSGASGSYAGSAGGGGSGGSSSSMGGGSGGSSGGGSSMGGAQGGMPSPNLNFDFSGKKTAQGQSNSGSSGGTSNKGGPRSQASRGKNWALPQAKPHHIGITRSIHVSMQPDRIVLLPEAGDSRGPKTVPVAPEIGPDDVTHFVTAVQSEIKGWGLAVSDGYWKPVVQADVAPGAERHFTNLQMALKESGIELNRR